MDPFITPALTGKLAQVMAQQGVQFGKARMRKRATVQERKDAYERFQDAALACMSTFMAAAAIQDTSVKAARKEQAAEQMFMDLTRDTALLGQGLRRLYLVGDREMAAAADRITTTLMTFDPVKGMSGVEGPAQRLNEALIAFTTEARLDLQYDWPARKHWWEVWRPKGSRARPSREHLWQLWRPKRSEAGPG